ncbi:peptidoglycan-binding protein [Streptomyces purpureus]|uniref:Uncharacterized protein n=1 Tax=Streptomyces purpureus TaxID=1951 RepID=A0A918GYD5_9ACTN|nr:peptidoglycan-binding protein [Streptomyces purpureus]GGT14703.1 hypothetical protein GCM10014713_04320 [Streptomyces purpureus]
MPDIEVDTSQLTFPLFAVPEASTGLLDGSRTPPPTVSLPVGGGYHLWQESAPVPDFTFEVRADGTLDFSPDFDLVVTGRGERRLTVRGVPVRVDAIGLDHDLLLAATGIGGVVLTSDRPHDLRLLPGIGHRLDGGAGKLPFRPTPDGMVQLASDHSGFATAAEGFLGVRGRTLRVDGTGLYHDLLPLGMRGVTGFLSRTQVHRLTVLPGDGYGFQAGAGVVADLRFGVTNAGEVSLARDYTSFADASGDTLTVRGHTVVVDGTALSHDVLPTGASRTPVEFLSRTATHRLALVPARGYSFQPGAGTSADLSYEVTRDGQVKRAEQYAAFADASGDTLTLRGHTITLDGTALSHDVIPLGLARGSTYLSRQTAHRLTVLPAKGYGFQSAVAVAELAYDVTRAGEVRFHPSYAGFAEAVGSTLILRGYRIVLDATGADSDLVGIAGLPGTGPEASTPREISVVLLPSVRYAPQTRNGVLTTGFTLRRDGRITFDPAVQGRYVVTTDEPSSAGEDVTVAVTVRGSDPADAIPGGAVAFGALTGALGSARLDRFGRAALRTSGVPLGPHGVSVEYLGDGDFLPSSGTVAHRVEPRTLDPAGEPLPDPVQPELLDWSRQPVLASMADPHEVNGSVKLAQALLNAAGSAVPPLVVDGNFGPLTLLAVRHFQQSRYLPGTDRIDRQDWYALALAAPFPLLEPGPRTPVTTGPPVAQVQNRLNRRGALPPLVVDAAYGPDTVTAVRAFQAERRLATTGTTTPETWAALTAPEAPGPSTRTMRLTFSYDSADWAAGGPPIRLVSREELVMTAPPCEDLTLPAESLASQSGFRYEVVDAEGQVLYRRGRHLPIRLLGEVPSDTRPGGLSSSPLDAPKGVFVLLAPVFPGMRTLVVHSSPLDPGRLHEPASELARFDIG